MSTFRRASARNVPRARRRLLALVTLLPLVTGLAMGVASAEPPPAVLRLSASEAQRSGAAISLLRHDLPGAALLEVAPPPSSTAHWPLAAAADGRIVALSGPPGTLDGELTIASADGSQVRIHLAGVSGAGFAPAGDRLAAIDGNGSLWLVDAGSGASRRVADGPFVGSPVFAADGSLLVLSASSVEAPYRSSPVRIDPEGGSATPLSGDELVYGVFPLADGALALVVHQPGGTVVKRVGGGDASVLADLGPDATSVDVSADGSRIAFQRGALGVFLIDGLGAPARHVGAGSAPTISPDGGLLLVRRGASTALLSSDAAVLGEYAGAVAFIDCEGGCLP